MVPRIPALAFALLAGCHAEPVPGDSFGRAHSDRVKLPVGRQRPIEVPTPPPRVDPDPSFCCDAGELLIPGQWDYAGAWYFIPPTCVVLSPGYVYVPPRYQGGFYVRGHIVREDESGPLPSYRPVARVSLEHPPEMQMRAPSPERSREEPAPTNESTLSPSSPSYFSPWFFPERFHLGGYGPRPGRPGPSVPAPGMERPGPAPGVERPLPGTGQERPGPVRINPLTGGRY